MPDQLLKRPHEIASGRALFPKRLQSGALDQLAEMKHYIIWEALAACVKILPRPCDSNCSKEPNGPSCDKS